MKIALSGIDFSYQDGKDKKQIFKNFSLGIESGEFLIISGPSGCGKSTLLNIIGGLLKPEAGRVFLGGSSYYDMTTAQRERYRRKRMGYIFQSFYLIEDLSPVDNVLITMREPDLKIAEKKKKIENILRELGIYDKRNSKIGSFSGGEQQRLAIARAIAQESRLLICDEPTGNLDEENAVQIMDILKKINNKGQTIIVVTHNRNLSSYADKVLELTPAVRLGGGIS